MANVASLFLRNLGALDEDFLHKQAAASDETLAYQPPRLIRRLRDLGWSGPYSGASMSTYGQGKRATHNTQSSWRQGNRSETLEDNSERSGNFPGRVA